MENTLFKKEETQKEEKKVIERENYYTVIPMKVITDSNLTPMMKIIYGILTSLSNRYGYCSASNQYIGDLLNMKSDTISTHISGLVKSDYIRIELKKELGNRRTIFIRDLSDKNSTPLREISETSPRNIGDTYNINNNIIYNIYNAYKTHIHSSSRLTQEGKKKIKVRLQKFSEKELIEAIENFSKSPWWMKNNKMRGIQWFFKNDDRIDQFINLKDEAKSKVHIIS